MNQVLKDMLSSTAFAGTALRFVRTLQSNLYLPAGVPRQIPSHPMIMRFADDVQGHIGEYYVKENVNRRLPPGRNSGCRRQWNTC